MNTRNLVKEVRRMRGRVRGLTRRLENLKGITAAQETYRLEVA